MRLFFRSSGHILFAAIMIIVSLVPLTAGLACSREVSIGLAADASNEVSVTTAVDSNNSLIVHINGTVEAPGDVTVEYQSGETGPFITEPVPTHGTAFSIEIMRLRASTQYDFKVFLTGSSENPALQYQGTFITRPLPVELQDVSIQLIQGTPTYDLLLLDHNDTDFSGIIAIDRGGAIVWYYQQDKQVFAVTRDNQRNLLFNELSLVEGYSMTRIAPDGTNIQTINDTNQDGTVNQPHGRWHHEMLLRPDNKVWTLGSEIREVNIDGTVRMQTGDTIEEWDLSTNTVTRLVSLFDIMDPAVDRTEASNITTGFFWRGGQDQYADVAEDWTHSNSLNVLPDGTVLISLRHLNQIIAVKPDLSGVAWRLGGPGSDFTFPDPADQFYHQHYAHWLPSGHILLFDNGNTRPVEEGGQYSRALELELDWDTMEARKVWEYRHTPDLYAGAVCSAFKMRNGNTVVDFGYNDVDPSPVFTLVEADPAGNAAAVTRLSAPGKNTQYRAIPIDSVDGEKEGSVLLE